ncbi:unnamed protein product [Blepharisma stoltei]|uniref:Nucleoporin Nup54 alpha-helical domain-containing protein n=1 Tax=Blepharisma stoltei TaxID=1481888 RepID=A0AAU9ITN1_9CILI|nr:unnamed protein product [Blepharisma stoltei]
MQESQAAQELESISGSVKAYHPSNKFKAMIYNVAPKSTSVQQLQSSKYQPRIDANEFYYIDTALSEEAMVKNPDPDKLYPWQINSCKQLADRVSADNDTSNLLSYGLDNMDNHLKTIENELNLKSTDRIRQINEGQSKLSERLCTIRWKLEQFLESRNSIKKDLGEELKIRAKIDHLNKKMEMKSKLERINTQNVSMIGKVNVPQEEVGSILNILREQRENVNNLRKLVSADSNLASRIEEAVQRFRKSN